MDCHFYEDTFYHTQSSSPLYYCIRRASDKTIDLSKELVSPLYYCPVPPNEHPSSPENPFNVPSEQIDTIDNNPIDIVTVSMPNRYELPLISTRGVPPKRYDLEFEALRSKYPISKKSNKPLSETTMAFNASLYSSDIPRNI